MHITKLAAIALSTVFAAGCVSTAEHKKITDDLQSVRAQLAEAGNEKDTLSGRVATLEKENTRLANHLLAAQSAGSESQVRLQAVRKRLESEQQSRREYEERLARLKDENQQTSRLSEEMRRERDQIRSTSEDLHRQLDTVRQELDNRTSALAQAEARIATLDGQKADVDAALAATQNEARDLRVQLAAERENVARISEEKQRLMTGTTTAKEEIARLQHRVGQLEAVAARVEDLDRRLGERDQEIGRLREVAADRESLAMKMTGLDSELEQAKGRIATLTGELAALSEEANRVRQERDRYAQDVDRLQEDAADKAAELRRLAGAQRELMDSLQQVRAEKETEVRRLTETQKALNETLRAEIEKGDIRIQQVRDRLTINMVDRVLFDSGRAELKSEGLEVLKRVSAVLKGVDDKQIRIEGHTDNVPIGPRIKDRFPTNWELSTARATSVVRFLVDKGGVSPGKLTAVGFADTKPVADNETEEGRQANRRIEIVLYPKDLPALVEDIQS